MALPHDQHDEEKGEDGEECHHAVDPSNADRCHPLVDIEADRQAKSNAKSADDNACLRGIIVKHSTR